jgi:hypothetical protein
MTVLYIDAMTARFGGCATGTVPVAAAWNRRIQKTGRTRSGNCANGFTPETTTRSPQSVRASSLRFGEWADFFVENYSKPPIRAEKTHEVNENALKTLRPVFGPMKLAEIDATGIEAHLRQSPQATQTRAAEIGDRELGLLKPATVHQEFRMLRRIFSVAVKKKLCPANPCAGVEFPVILKGLFRPHYVTCVGAADD